MPLIKKKKKKVYIILLAKMLPQQIFVFYSKHHFVKLHR